MVFGLIALTVFQFMQSIIIMQWVETRCHLKYLMCLLWSVQAGKYLRLSKFLKVENSMHVHVCGHCRLPFPSLTVTRHCQTWEWRYFEI